MAIVQLAHRDPAVAQAMHAVMSLACAQEARLLQVADAAPLGQTVADIVGSEHFYLGAVEAGEVVAVLSIGRDDEAGQLCIFHLVVHPARQRLGLGRQLVGAALARGPGMAFAVCAAAANAPALALYAAFGFVAYRQGVMGPQRLPLLKLRRAATDGD